MATLKDIKKRITSVQSTRQITRTMEMVATASIRKAQERIENARPYALATTEVLGNVVSSVGSVAHPLLAVREERKRVCIICMASDRGLAGAFNSNVIRLTERLSAEYAAQGVKVELITVGKKVLGYFRYRGIEPAMSLIGMSAKPTYDNAREIAEYVRSSYEDQTLDAVHIVFNRFKNVAEQRPEVLQLLPIEQTTLERVETDVEERGRLGEYIFEPSPEAVLSHLLPTYVETLVLRALLESAASELGARRTAMKLATDNATEIIGTLQRSYNRARQAAITTEISEIVGGAAALEDRD